MTQSFVRFFLSNAGPPHQSDEQYKRTSNICSNPAIKVLAWSIINQEVSDRIMYRKKNAAEYQLSMYHITCEASEASAS